VEWVKAKNEAGDKYDCIEVVRAFPKDSKRKQTPIQVKLNFYLEHNPKKYRLSPTLAKVLGIEEESRLRIVGALWQYIKSNRL
jgi:chromatin remodeling complex protein RSC6